MNSTWLLYNFLYFSKSPTSTASLKYHDSPFLSNPEVHGTVSSTMEQGQQGIRMFFGLRDSELVTKMYTPKTAMEGAHVFGLNFNSAYEFCIVPVIKS